MSNKIVSIIIVAAGTRDYLKFCLDSIRGQGYPDKEIIVIDNSLKPDFEQEFRQSYPEIKLYPSRENLSYCQALNKGIGVSKGDFILCLNDDVVLDKDFIDEALKCFTFSEDTGIVSGKILRFDKVTIDSAGLSLSIWRTAEERGYGDKDKGQFQGKCRVFGVNGAVAFYRRNLLEQIKLGEEYFDSDFGYFYEDLDVSWRAHRFGWKGYYTPTALAYHLRGGTARQGSNPNKRFARHCLNDDLLFDLMKNRYLAIIKNESFFNLIIHFPFILFYDVFAWGYLLFFRPRLIKRAWRLIKTAAAAFKKRKLMDKRLEGK